MPLEPVELEQVETVEAATEQLATAQARGQPFDRVLSHWGAAEVVDDGGERLANCFSFEDLLREIEAVMR